MKLSEDKENIIISLNVEDLLDKIPNSDIHYYASQNLDMIHIDDADDHCECEILTLDDYDDDELLEKLEYRGFSGFFLDPKQSIVREIAINKLMEFLQGKTDAEVISIVDKLV